MSTTETPAMNEKRGPQSKGDADSTTLVSSGGPDGERKGQSQREDGKIILDEDDCPELLGFSFSPIKRWTILSVIFAVQTSMNLNASIYGNAVTPLTEQFGVSAQAARVGQGIFLITYAFGCELWAPWSEEYGRWIVLQLSLLLVNIWQIPCALAPNLGTMIVCRGLGGLSSAGGSVTLGMVADMWHAENQHYAVAFVVLSSVGGSVLGPIVGAPIEQYSTWHWIFWTQLIFGVVVQAAHALLVPETRVTIILNREAKRRRKAGEGNIYGPTEKGVAPPMTLKHLLTTWSRPFYMFATEPIVLFLSLLSGFSDALVFTFLAAFPFVYEQWNFSITAIGLAFLPIAIAYILAYFSFFPFYWKRDRLTREIGYDNIAPESRLYWLLWTVPLEAIGLFGFAWTSLGPAYNIPWIAPMLFSGLIGIANYTIYAATIDYMIEAYGPYSASATGGNGFARDFLAGIAAFYSAPMYQNIPGRPLEYASTILACFAVVVTVPVYFIYYKGHIMREKSPFAQSLAGDRKGRVEKRKRTEFGGGDGVNEKKKAADASIATREVV